MPDADEAANAALEEARSKALKILASAEVQHVYFNEFQSLSGKTDASCILGVNDRPVAVLHMSVAVAKSLALELLGLVNWYEKNTAQSVLTLADITQLIDSPSVAKPK